MEKKSDLYSKLASYAFKQNRKRREERGMCIRCGKRPAVPNRKHCNECLESARLSTKQSYDTRKAQGICVKCGKRPAAPGKVKCTECAQMYKADYEGGKDGI